MRDPDSVGVAIKRRNVEAEVVLVRGGWADVTALMVGGWDFRVASETDQLVRQAAETAERTLTDFVVDAGVVEADRVLADRTRFVLEAEQWERLVELLDRPPQEKPGLETLFSQPSVFTAS